MAYKVIILYRLYMPSYFLGTFTEYGYYYCNSNYCIIWIPYEKVCTKLSKRSTN